MNKIFAALIILTLSFPTVFAEGENFADTQTKEPVIETTAADNIAEENNTLAEENNTSAEENVIPAPAEEKINTMYKEPVSKKKLAKKFIIAMLCVVGTAIFLYVILSLYNKIREGFISSSAPVPPEGERPLDTPQDLTEAVQTFVEKTKWEG